MAEYTQLTGAQAYMEAVQARLDAIMRTQAETIDRAASALIAALERDGQIYLFGTGHSHMLAEEGHFRAGGFAAVCPILSGSLMLHEGAVVSTQLERLPGLGPTLLARYRPVPPDVLVIFSNSGVNAVPVEVALAAKERGLTVIGIVAQDYSAQVPAGPSGQKLADVADIVVDNQGVPGDALVPLGDGGLRVGPLSTIAGAFILNAILTEVAWRIYQDGRTPPVYISANMPDAQAHNQALVERYRLRNPHL